MIKEWEVVEKTLPDGTKKRYRRRVIIVKPNKSKNDIPMVEETPLGHELIPIDESNPEDEKYNPKVFVIYFSLLNAFLLSGSHKNLTKLCFPH